MTSSPEQTYSVSAVNRMARYLLEESFPAIWVEGEIANYLHHSSGHRYFSLRDDTGQLRAVMWRSIGATLRFQPEDGLKVIARGMLTVYERGGQYQLIVNRMLPSGMGALELAFQQLREKLDKEGLFDPARKKPLPSYPTRIGIVTSATGAVIRDIIRVAGRRNPRLKLILWPAAVQGDDAPPQLVAGIEELNAYGKVDVIIIGRGGGSLEDLWAFNDERVVRAVSASRVPILSAVGHEVDYTLVDLAADYSAATPSMAAELVSWLLSEFEQRVRGLLGQMKNSARAALSDQRERLHHALRSPAMMRPETMVQQRFQAYDAAVRLLHLTAKNLFDNYKKALSLRVARLDSLSPLNVLKRGYSVTRREADKQVIRDVAAVSPGDDLETLVENGAIFSTVRDVRKK